MKKLITSIIVVLLAGCSSQDYKGNGEYFELANRHVIERDLSILKPTQISQTEIQMRQNKITKTGKVTGEISTIEISRIYTLYRGESTKTAILRWLRASSYKNIAWSMNAEHQAVLEKINTKSVKFRGTLQKLFSLLSAKLEIPVRLTVDKHNKVAGIYDFNDVPRITHLKGYSLKTIVKQLVKNYGLVWSEQMDENRSWLAPNDYVFSADYYLLTPKNDISTALKTVLSGYPVRASIVASTNQVFILEK